MEMNAGQFSEPAELDAEPEDDPEGQGEALSKLTGCNPSKRELLTTSQAYS